MTNYSNGYIYEFTLTIEFCEATFAAANLLSFRLVKVYHISLSLISMLSILYFVIYHKNDLKFHFNMKILFYFQFIFSFAHSTIVGVSQTHHLITAIFSSSPCDVVLPPTVYKYLHVPFLFTLFCTGSSQVVMVVEQSISTYFLPYYEKMTKRMGYFLIILTFSCPVSTCIFFFYDASFDYPVMSFLSTTPSAGLRINGIFLLFIVFYIFTVFYSIFLYRYNKKQNGASRSTTHLELSSKYRMTENLTSSRILWQLTSTQLSIFLIYGISVFSIRVFTPSPRPAVWVMMTELCYSPPIYCAIMPILCIFSFKKERKDRIHKIESIVSIRSTGREGWDNYQKMLRDQWA